MARERLECPIRTVRLHLVVVTTGFVEAVLAADAARAGAAIGVRVGTWLTADPSHLVQLNLARQAAEARGFPGLGRVIVLDLGSQLRTVIGTIGFHGPPDERGRLEVSCRLHPAHRSRGYAAEALSGLLDWATAGYGVTRFLVDVAPRREGLDPVPVEIADRQRDAPDAVDAQVDEVARLLEWPTAGKG